MAVKPFLGAVKNSVPSDWKDSKVNLNEPDCSLDLEYVHGYRCFDTRNNIYFLDQDNIIFHTAAVSVKLNIGKN
jgi:microtubule-associated protein-like 6